MKFGDYIDLIQNEPTDLRIFLFDPIKHAPKLLEDYRSPTNLMGGFLDKYPNMFFGGAGSVLFCITILISLTSSILILTAANRLFCLIRNGVNAYTVSLLQPMH